MFEEYQNSHITKKAWTSSSSLPHNMPVILSPSSASGDTVLPEVSASTAVTAKKGRKKGKGRTTGTEKAVTEPKKKQKLMPAARDAGEAVHKDPEEKNSKVQDVLQASQPTLSLSEEAKGSPKSEPSEYVVFYLRKSRLPLM
jgi:hypothetical protein